MFWYSQAPYDICLSLGIFAQEGNYLKTKNVQSSLPENEPFYIPCGYDLRIYNLDYAKCKP